MENEKLNIDDPFKKAADQKKLLDHLNQKVKRGEVAQIVSRVLGESIVPEMVSTMSQVNAIGIALEALGDLLIQKGVFTKDELTAQETKLFEARKEAANARAAAEAGLSEEVQAAIAEAPPLTPDDCCGDAADCNNGCQVK